MTRLLLLTLLILPLGSAVFAQDTETDTIDPAFSQTTNEGIPDRVRRNRIGIRAGYNYFKPEPARNGYDFGIDYAYYLSPRLFAVGEYMYGFSDNKKEVNQTGNYLWGSIRRHQIGLGLGYDLLSKKGHRLFASGTIGVGHNYYKHDELIASAPFRAQAITKEGWSGAYGVSAGYRYLVATFCSVGLNWEAVFVSPDWCNTLNIQLNYHF